MLITSVFKFCELQVQYNAYFLKIYKKKGNNQCFQIQKSKQIYASFSFKVKNLDYAKKNITKPNILFLSKLRLKEFSPFDECCLGQVVTMWTMPRCGSTLVAKMLQATDQTNRCVLVFSEPDAFSMLAIMVGQYALSVCYARSLLLAVLRYSCKDQLLQQTIIFKMRLFRWSLLHVNLSLKMNSVFFYLY